MISDIFEAPYPSSKNAEPYLPHLDPIIEIKTPTDFVNLPIWSLVSKITGLNQNQACDLIDFGAIWLNNKLTFDPDYLLSENNILRINVPFTQPDRYYEASENRIIFEDESLIIYNKESGRPSQAVPYDAYNNILAGLVRLRKSKHTIFWLPHRLDADTSGLIIVAKSKEAAANLNRQFQNQAVEKAYLAAVVSEQPLAKSFVVENYIYKDKGKYHTRDKEPGLWSKTYFTLWETRGQISILKAKPLTGRTHQIRLHLKEKLIPIIGDKIYGNISGNRLMLKAVELAFQHPMTEKKLYFSLIA